ncbi:hypothetical protein Ancab_021182 [Ancistrocladus abbreviatus]
MALALPINPPWTTKGTSTIKFSSTTFASNQFYSYSSQTSTHFICLNFSSSFRRHRRCCSYCNSSESRSRFIKYSNHTRRSHENRRFFLKSSSCCFCCCCRNSPKKGVRNRSKIEKFFDDTHRSRKDYAFTNPGPVMLDGNSKNQNTSPPIKAKGRSLSLISLFTKRSLWQRIFFPSKRVRGIILLNLITVVYASNIPVVKEVEATMDPAAFSVFRFAVSAIPFVPFAFRARNDAHTRRAGVELGVWVSLGYLMQALGLLTSDAGRSSFISMLTVIVVPLLEGMLGVKVPALTWFGALMSVIGVAMLESSGSPPCVGDLLTFLSAVFFGVHMLRTERIARITNKENYLPLLGYEVCVIAVLSIMWYFIGGWCAGTQGWDPHSWSWKLLWESLVSVPWIPAIYTGFFSTGLCLWVEMAAMRDISATETAIIYGLEPVWGAGFAWFFLGERWGPAGWVGAALIIGASLMVQIFGSLPSQTEDEEGGEKDANELDVVAKQTGFSAPSIVVSPRKISNKLEK